MPIDPDTKNWTWVLERACPDCGFDSSAVVYDDIPDLIRADVERWEAVLRRKDVALRPDDSTWSALEYAAHVRDAHRIFRTRLALVLTEDDPEFANWDQDATALAENYNSQNPATVASELGDAARALADDFAAVPPENRHRTGRRSDGSNFSVESLAAYYIHDPIHHLWDVRG
ncbi:MULTISPECIES: DinB family protein [unclassified Rhodococcus (in: high G+C Gram-positive bacteria)]|uniref:DinB family protein n=1 Tax=unclassified Rhodococcus (in: high G+C Gram-positive bacteria) TaxID=192944 RepID=UPI000B9BFF6D|nr:MULTISPECIES: DinB family protein [unclassified Rhodococcus (in: high G+C Gram-positive bacteria)]OZE35327.1 methyltransferase type 12 [Rhodococcus sp. 05-2254-4]OZE47755.1 methyltransferase type 12 [Rhodococcus sp. 05-2254-3]OZE48966.1 methyltransferase type 12 [Rhodococcus sp. 05-2254-2]